MAIYGERAVEEKSVRKWYELLFKSRSLSEEDQIFGWWNWKVVLYYELLPHSEMIN